LAIERSYCPKGFNRGIRIDHRRRIPAGPLERRRSPRARRKRQPRQRSTWSRVVLPGFSACAGGGYLRASDPWVSFSPNGDPYAISLSFLGVQNLNHNAILVSKSPHGPNVGDAGTWSAPVALTEDDTKGLDRQSITADPFDSNYVYAAWDRIITPGGSTHASDQGIVQVADVLHADDERRSELGDAQEIFVESSFSGSIGSIVRVLGDRHTLVDGLITYGSADWKGGPCGSESVLRSPDRGVSWTKKPVIVSPLTCTYVCPQPGLGSAHSQRRASRHRGRRIKGLHGVGGCGLGRAHDRTDPVLSVGGRRIELVAPHRDQPSPAGIDAMLPTIAVNSAGTVGVSYYDFRNNVPGGIASTDLWLTRCSSSCASAANWSADTRVTPTSFDMSAAPEARGQFIGNYMGMTTSGATFEPFFMQSGTPPVLTLPTDAFFASVP
jgi:hypothetical protein